MQQILSSHKRDYFDLRRIAAHMEEILALFQKEICVWFPNWEYAQENCEGLVKVIGVLILALLGGITWGAKTLITFLMARRAHSSLAPYVTRSEVRQSLKYFVPTRVQATSPSDQPDFKKLQPSEPYIDFFINKVFKDADDSERFHLVLGGAGMGKTTFMINLAIRYRFSLMWRPWRIAYQIQYLPLWEEKVIEKIQEIKEPPKTILLLDALDEDPLAHDQVDQRLKDLVKAAKDFHTVIVTSRTQFFDTQDQIPDSTEVYRLNRYMEFDKMYVAPFSPKEIQKYLRKRFRFRLLRREKAWNLVNQFRDIMARPMILAYIDDLLKGKQEYQFKYQVYERIITEWIERESNKPHVEPGEQVTCRDNLLNFSKEIAFLIYERYQKSEGQYVEDEVFARLSEQNDLTLNAKEMKGKSLLTRNSANQWKFAHKSIMEYFLAELALEWRINSGLPDEFDVARTFYGEKLGIEMIRVGGGVFMMGSDDESGKPAQKVETGDFFIGKYPVTQRQWKVVMGEKNNSSKFKGDELPVENVSWHDCQEFIRTLNQNTGMTYRLLSEAEWEFAVRGGKKSRGFQYGGSDDVSEVAWFEGNAIQKTHPVGQKKPNELGIHDMSGNVWEWCQDRYDLRYYKKMKREGRTTNPEEPDSGADRVVRGGSWVSLARNCRVSDRGRYGPGFHDGALGFRLSLPQFSELKPAGAELSTGPKADR